MFKVVPDQLRVSEGWVRCGQCDEVFDANAYLQKRGAPEQVVAPITPTITPTIAPPPAPAAIAEAVRDTASGQAFEMAQGAETREAVFEHIEAVAIDLPEVPAPMERQLEPEEVSVSFMTSSHKSTVPTRFGVTVLWGLVAGMLLLSLSAQVLVQERDRIAATEPAAVALLGPLCEVTGCSLSPLRQIESVVIDSSAFTKIRPDLYRLSFALKNTALVDVATPALELTLTDMQDQALVRRVFTARELSAQKPAMLAGGEWSSSMPVSVQLPSANDRISGYRLLAFYP